MALDAVISVIIQKLRDVVAEESITSNKVIGTQLKEMQDELEKMQGFFIDAADKETNVGAIKKWTDDYLQNLYEVEDAIESFALRITRQRKRMGFLMNHALFLKNFTACKMLSRKLKKIQRKFVLLEKQKPDDVENASLRSNRSHHNYEQNDAQIDSSSDVRFSRCTLGEIHEEMTNTNDYAGSNDITPFAENSTSTSSFTEDSSPKASKAKKFSSMNSIIRERCEQVAKHAFPKSPPYHMKKLDDQDSWKLFLRKVPLEKRNECSTLEKKIIKICNGLPMNIILLGSLLSTKKVPEWVPILDSQGNGQNLDILSLCYNDLDAHSKLCLLYLMLFPQEYNIPIRRLLRLWLAEGFVKRPEKQEILQDEVQKCFDNLVIRSLLKYFPIDIL